MEMRTYWLSKYALIHGVRSIEGRPSERYAGYIVAGRFFEKLGHKIHETEGGARQAAEVMRILKIASLKKQIAKLESMSFIGGDDPLTRDAS